MSYERRYQLVILLLAAALIYSLSLVNKVNLKLPTFKSSPPPLSFDADSEQYDWEVAEIARDLAVPWDLALLPDGRILLTERAGKVKLIDQSGQAKTIANFEQVSSVGESGMTGLTLHPNFLSNGYVYIYYTYRASGSILNRVSRFTLNNDLLLNEAVLIDSLPGGSIHNGGRMRFGPDQKLWILTGDAARPQLAQDPKSLAGKVLRVDDDGSVPDDNPTKGSPVYSFGHRNPQGLDWHPLTEELVATEHGETAHDEINIIKADGNYGWPEVNSCFGDSRLVEPILCSEEDTWAPSGGAFLGTKIWHFRNSFFFAGLRGQLLERIDIIDGKVANRQTIIKNKYGRLRAVLADQQGSLYISTSNLDGRGQPNPGDDKILKLTPKKKN